MEGDFKNGPTPQAWISGHIWTRRSLRLAKAEHIFDTPFYDALLVQQSLLLNRRMDDEKENLLEFLAEHNQRQARILGCATMWHETEAEMTALMDSVLRIDEAEARLLHDGCEDAFKFELHIFFDDAFTSDGSLNAFVCQLIDLLHSKEVQLVEKIPSPFGGQLVWRLAHGTKVLVYLKDKSKVLGSTDESKNLVPPKVSFFKNYILHRRERICD
jgi:chitin synthase